MKHSIAVFKQAHKTLLEMEAHAFHSMHCPECAGKWHCPIVENLDDESLRELSDHVDKTFQKIVANAALGGLSMHLGIFTIDPDVMSDNDYDTVIRLGYIRTLIMSEVYERHHAKIDQETQLRMVPAPELASIN
jgi:hypothetical protein